MSEWRQNDGTPQTGRIEYRDRAHRLVVKNGSEIAWALLGHSDDVIVWRRLEQSYSWT